MTTLLAEEPMRTSVSPAQWLRQIAAAVRVSFTWWGVHRSLTDQQKEEVGLACSADSALLTAGKKLIDTRHPAFRNLTSLRGRIAAFWRQVSLPYVEPGMRLIRQEEIEKFTHVMQGYQDDLQHAEAELAQAFEQIKADARRRLGRLFDPSQYPAEVRGLFGVSWDFPSVEPPAYLMRLNPEIYRQEQERVSQRFEQAVALAEQAFLGEFARLVEHLCERLNTDTDGQRKVFRDSILENLTDFFEKFRHLNVRSSQELDALVERAQNVVRGITPQDLREDDRLRQRIATQFSQVQASIDGMLVDQPRRRILRSRPSGEEG